MISIQVKLVGALARHLPPNGQAPAEVAQNSTPDDLIKQLGLAADQRYMVSVNGEFIRNTETAAVQLSADDRVTIMPALKGG